jgi:hypothetical protein
MSLRTSWEIVLIRGCDTDFSVSHPLKLGAKLLLRQTQCALFPFVPAMPQRLLAHLPDASSQFRLSLFAETSGSTILLVP